MGGFRRFQLVLGGFRLFLGLVSTFHNGTFEKNTITVMEVVLMQLQFLIICSKQKTKMVSHGIFISFKSQLYSKQGSPIFLWFGSWTVALYLHVRVKSKFSDNSNLIILVDLQRSHENGKWILFVSNGVYTLLKRAFFLSHLVLSTFFIYNRVKAS